MIQNPNTALAVDETVGATFQIDLLQTARDMTLKVILSASREVRPGMTENEVKTLVSQIQSKLGAPKSWHPPQIRFGKNTTLAFGERGVENPSLSANDIFFFDIGPIFDGHEGDVGRTFFIGGDPEMQKCCKDVEAIWLAVRDHWKNEGCSGAELYSFAEKCAEDRGWVLSLKKADGHRIADFPHAAKTRGSISAFDHAPASHRWILEIQIRHPTRPFGAFYEDLLG